MVMKKLIFSLCCVLLVFGCAVDGNFTTGAPPIPSTLCEEHAAAKPDSVLLKIQAEYNVPLNEVYYGLIDTTRIMMITDVADKEWIAEYLDKIAIFYNANYPNLTFDRLIAYMVSKDEWGEKLSLALSILSTRIGYFRVGIMINVYDDCMLRAGWSHAKKLLFIAKEDGNGIYTATDKTKPYDRVENQNSFISRSNWYYLNRIS
jgi:hypothetical protein